MATPALEAFLGSHPGAPVYFTGHSLGAALATISVTRFQGAAGALYTAAPRVGDDRFVRAVLQKTMKVGGPFEFGTTILDFKAVEDPL